MDPMLHVVPNNDYIKHNLETNHCVCGQRIERVVEDDGSVGWLIVHHSLDGREFRERGEPEG